MIRGLAALVALAAAASCDDDAADRPAEPEPQQQAIVEIPLPADVDQIADPALRAAIAEHRSEVEQSPRSAGVWGALGRLYHVHGYPALAVEAYRQAATLAPGDHRWFYLTGRALLRDDPAAAARAFERALALRPLYVPAAYYRALALIETGELAEARVLLQDVAARRPDHPLAAFRLGQIALAEGELNAARDYLLRATALNPRNSPAHAALAEVFERLGDEAAAAHHAALATRPAAMAEMRDPVWREVEAAGASRRWHAIRGKRHLDEGRLGEAVADLSVAVAQGQTDPLIWLNYGTALAALERTREAVDALETALTLATAADGGVALNDEITGLILNNLGVALFRRGEVLMAEERFRQALAVDPTSDRAVANLAAVLATRRRLPEAIALIEETLAERPSPVLERMQRVLPLRAAEPVLEVPDAAVSAEGAPGAAEAASPP